MSKKIKGEYGSYKAAVLDDRLKKHCIKKGITQVKFFEDVFKLHPYGWYRGVRSSQYGEKTELIRLCELCGCSFKELDFKKGEKPTEKYLVAPVEPEYVQETLNLNYPQKIAHVLQEAAEPGGALSSPIAVELINQTKEKLETMRSSLLYGKTFHIDQGEDSMDVVIDRFTADLNTLLKALLQK